MELTVVLLVSSIIALFFGILGFVLGLSALIKVNALKESTHTVQWMPLKEDETWATSDESLDTQNKLFKKELEEKMPEFALDDEDKKIFSF